MDFEKRAKELGYIIEPAQQLTGRPMKAIKTGNLIYTSGQLSIKNGIDIKGRVGKDLTIEEAQEAAIYATLNCLSAIKTVIGSLNNITQVIKILGMVNVSDDFNDTSENNTSKVIDGCSNLLHDIFGETGKHARSAVGMILPRNFAVEIEMIVEIKSIYE